MRVQTTLALFVFGLLAGCAGEGPKTATLDDLRSTEVRFPNGTKIRAEMAFRPYDITRGLMFRDSMPMDRGFVILNKEPAIYAIWTYNGRFPLDVIWLDSNRIITEVIANVPPCKAEKASQCPKYGGRTRSQFVLELNAGVAEKNGLKPGDRLDF
ncbi:MAG: DUF192 domain-containing protein [Acidobacteria bacterium]|nr:DUF192 domain-containing protein [Acidobacteriota bacterium]